MKLQTIKLLGITAFVLFISQFTLPVNAAESQQKSYSSESEYVIDQNDPSSQSYVNEAENPYLSKRSVSERPMPRRKYQKDEYIAACSIVAMAILVGTGRSIKYLENDRQSNQSMKGVPGKSSKSNQE